MYKVHFNQKIIIFNLRSGIEAVLSRTENISTACDIWSGTHKGISKQHISVSHRADNPYNEFAEQGKEQFREAVCWLSKYETCEYHRETCEHHYRGPAVLCKPIKSLTKPPVVQCRA